MLLVGSQALSIYTDLNRRIGDYDFWVKDWNDLPEKIKKLKPVKTTDMVKMFLYNGKIIDVVKIKDETDLTIFNRSKTKTKVLGFEVSYPSIEDLYVMTKVSSEIHDRVKYSFDLKTLNQRFNIEPDKDLYSKRYAETKNRVDASVGNKYEFFHKYDLPEHIEHDLLHVWVADFMELSRPTYELFIEGDTTPNEEFFNNLPRDYRISRFVEESLVLSFERWLIPKMVQHGIYNTKILNFFFDLDNPACPPRKLLNHVCFRGLRDEPKFMSKFGTENFGEIEQKYLKTVESLKDSNVIRKIQKKIVKNIPWEQRA